MCFCIDATQCAFYRNLFVEERLFPFLAEYKIEIAAARDSLTIDSK